MKNENYEKETRKGKKKRLRENGGIGRRRRKWVGIFNEKDRKLGRNFKTDKKTRE